MKRLYWKNLEKLTPEGFSRLPYEDRLYVLEECKANWLVVHDLIRDRNELRDCYFKLKQQLIEAGIEPAIDYYSMHKGDKKNA